MGKTGQSSSKAKRKAEAPAGSADKKLRGPSAFCEGCLKRHGPDVAWGDSDEAGRPCGPACLDCKGVWGSAFSYLTWLAFASMSQTQVRLSQTEQHNTQQKKPLAFGEFLKLSILGSRQ